MCVASLVPSSLKKIRYVSQRAFRFNSTTSRRTPGTFEKAKCSSYKDDLCLYFLRDRTRNKPQHIELGGTVESAEIIWHSGWGMRMALGGGVESTDAKCMLAMDAMLDGGHGVHIVIDFLHKL